MALLFIGIGGFFGSIGRILSQTLAQRYFPIDFPVGTIVVNIAGSFLAGLIYGLAEHRGFLSPQTRLFLLSGVCGGFTTFSSFSLETLNLLHQSQFGAAAIY